MKNVLLILIVVFATMSCVKEEVKKNDPPKPTEEQLDLAVNQLNQEMGIGSKANSAAALSRLSDFHLSYSFVNWDVFQLNGTWGIERCINQRYRIEYHLWSSSTGTWAYWGTRQGQSCLPDLNTTGQKTGGDQWVWMYAYVYNYTTGALITHGLSNNGVFLANP